MKCLRKADNGRRDSRVDGSTNSEDDGWWCERGKGMFLDGGLRVGREGWVRSMCLLFQTEVMMDGDGEGGDGEDRD